MMYPCSNKAAHERGIGYHDAGTFYCIDCNAPVSGRSVSDETNERVRRAQRVHVAKAVLAGGDLLAQHLARLVLAHEAPDCTELRREMMGNLT